MLNTNKNFANLLNYLSIKNQVIEKGINDMKNALSIRYYRLVFLNIKISIIIIYNINIIRLFLIFGGK